MKHGDLLNDLPNPLNCETSLFSLTLQVSLLVFQTFPDIEGRATKTFTSKF